MKIPSLVQTAFAGLKTSYALVNDGRAIVEHDVQFPLWVTGQSGDLIGRLLTDVLPELIGQEEEMARVSRGVIPYFRLENLNRLDEEGNTRYYGLVVIPYPSEAETPVAVLVTDMTDQGRYLQQLMQGRNELRLIRHKMAMLNYQLDYLIQHYLPSEVVNALLQGQLRPELGGELREISILFADVRGFTALTERLPAGQVVQLLNQYLNCVAEAIDEYEGTICQFQGDNVLVTFNAPVSQPDHPQRAVQAGVKVQQALALYRRLRPAEEPRLYFGVGISTGPALTGNIGAQWHYAYTPIGDAVNLAARLTAATPPNEVWLSQATYEYVQDLVEAEPIPPLTFKGKTQPTALFRVPLNLL